MFFHDLFTTHFTEIPWFSTIVHILLFLPIRETIEMSITSFFNTDEIIISKTSFEIRIFFISIDWSIGSFGVFRNVNILEESNSISIGS